MTAGAEEDDPSRDGGGERRGAASSLPAPSVEHVELVHGVPFVWPATDAPAYTGAEPWRALVARARAGATPAEAPGEPLTPAALYLAADLAFLRAAARGGGWIEAAEAYERALRDVPEFPDAARAWLVLGEVRLALGFGPEAGAAFRELERRVPSSPLVPEARLGQAAALRLARRPAAARAALDAVLAGASGDLACRARLEAAAQARAAGQPAAAADEYARIGADCPGLVVTAGALAAQVDALVASGAIEAARAAVAEAARASLRPDDAARVRLLAGRLAPDAGAARREYEAVLAMPVTPALAVEARMRLALLDEPEKAALALVRLASEPAPSALKAVVFGEAAEALMRAGRFEPALLLLDRASALGPDGAAQADGRRGEVLGRWLASLDAAGDTAGVAIVYAAHATELRGNGSVADRLTIARALGRIGLHGPAADLLAAGDRAASEPELAIALAEERLAAGDLDGARRAFAAAALPAHAVAARLALAAGDGETAAAEASLVDDPALRAEVSTALLRSSGGAAAASALLQPLVVTTTELPAAVLLVAGAAAAAEGAWGPAAATYRRALDEAATGAERAAAAAGLARAAHAQGDPMTLEAAAREDEGVARVARVLAPAEVARGR